MAAGIVYEGIKNGFRASVRWLSWLPDPEAEAQGQWHTLTGLYLVAETAGLLIPESMIYTIRHTLPTVTVNQWTYVRTLILDYTNPLRWGTTLAALSSLGGLWMQFLNWYTSVAPVILGSTATWMTKMFAAIYAPVTGILGSVPLGVIAILFASSAIFLHRTRGDDAQLVRLVDRFARSPGRQELIPADIAAQAADEDPIQDTIKTLDAHSGVRALLFRYSSRLYDIVASLLDKLVQLLLWLPKKIGLGVSIVLAAPFAPQSPLVGAFVGTLYMLRLMLHGLAAWTRLIVDPRWIFAATLYRRLSVWPRVEQPGGGPVALFNLCLGVNYYDIRKLNALEGGAGPPMVAARAHRYLSWWQWIRRPSSKRIAPRHLLFRYEEAICLNPTGPQHIVVHALHASDAVGAAPFDTFANQWQIPKARARYTLRTVTMGPPAPDIPARSYYTWSSPLAVAAWRIQTLGQLNQADQDALIIGLVQFQRDLLWDDRRSYSIYAELVVPDVLDHLAVSLSYYTGKELDTVKPTVQRIVPGNVYQLGSQDYAEVTKLVNAREPPDNYPIQLSLRRLRLAQPPQLPLNTARRIFRILLDYLCRLADVFSWIIVAGREANSGVDWAQNVPNRGESATIRMGEALEMPDEPRFADDVQPIQFEASHNPVANGFLVYLRRPLTQGPNAAAATGTA